MTRPRFRYSPWDGTQKGFEMDALDVLEELTDDLMYHGDVNAALRRMLQQGFEDRNGDRVQGLSEILEQLREQRQETLDRFDLGGVYDEIAEELEEVVNDERAAVEQQRRDDLASGDQRRAELAQQAADGRHLELDMLPDDLAGKVKGLEAHDFLSPEAEQRFEELTERLREQLMQQYVDQLSGAVQDMSPEDMARMKDMMAALNEMLEQRANGEEPDFEGFMERFGDFFPENPQTLDELLEIMAQRMAAAQAMLNSMTPEQRAQLQSLSEQLLEDMDLRWQADQLGRNLRDAFPDAGWDNSYSFEGADPLDMSSAMQAMSELSDMDALEQMLRGSPQPGALDEVDLDRVRELLGDEPAASLERMSEITKLLTEAGLVEQKEGRLELTPAGLRRLGRNALAELFGTIDADRMGGHRRDNLGVGHERAYITKPYEFGDPFNLDIHRTIHNAVMRGEGSPVSLSPEDFEIEQTEQTVRVSTVLMLDLSLSMPMRDNFLPAKKVAMALHSLISMQYPRDFMGLVAFSEVARVLTPEQLPEVSWDFVYGTNMQHGFQLARKMLARESGTKQIIMITDGEPTAHINRWGEPEFHYPPVRETVDATLLEVSRCTREDIRINTFMLDPDPGLQRFVENLTKLNRGRAFFTSPDTLGDYVLVDFLDQRRQLLEGGR
ncbi:MAG: VWA domain-containing protein [Microthrixaceae bacterium]|nr:VWA domain-containing protein [Microthrixaceae bacterium]MCO5322499.1 VWA domain-containing protein [Microthrixaceae bacterium]